MAGQELIHLTHRGKGDDGRRSGEAGPADPRPGRWHRRARWAVVPLVAAGGVGLWSGVAGAHHADITAATGCGTAAGAGASYTISGTVTDWQSSGPGSYNPDIAVSTAGVVRWDGAFTPGATAFDFHFVVQGAPGQTVTVVATVVGTWDDGAPPGDQRSVDVLLPGLCPTPPTTPPTSSGPPTTAPATTVPATTPTGPATSPPMVTVLVRPVPGGPTPQAGPTTTAGPDATSIPATPLATAYQAPVGQLATTGSQTTWPVAAGLAAVMVGGAMAWLAGTRRRRAPAPAVALAATPPATPNPARAPAPRVATGWDDRMLPPRPPRS